MPTLLLGETSLELVRIAAGEFIMGSDNRLFGETPAHGVKLRSGLLLGKFPVTQAQWQAVMPSHPSTFSEARFADASDRPVEGVSWDAAQEFCRRSSERLGCQIRLPSEAEWEYACRGGTTGEFHFSPQGPFADDGDIPWDVRRLLCDYAWFDLNSGDGTRPVGLKRPNPFGLYDMLGNVWEWCQDVWHSDYTAAPCDGRPWMDGVEVQPRRCLRGGAWDMNAFRCRSSYRSYDHRELPTDRFGLRVAVDGRAGD